MRKDLRVVSPHTKNVDMKERTKFSKAYGKRIKEAMKNAGLNEYAVAGAVEVQKPVKGRRSKKPAVAPEKPQMDLF